MMDEVYRLLLELLQEIDYDLYKYYFVSPCHDAKENKEILREIAKKYLGGKE